MAYLSDVLLRCAEREAPSPQPRRREALLLRWVLFGSLLGLGAAGPNGFPGSLLTGLSLGIFLVVTAGLSLLRLSAVRAPSFGISLAILDAAMISCLLFQADTAGALSAFFFLILVSSALSTRIPHILLGSTALSVLYLLLCGIRGTAAGVLSAPHLMALPFFYASALHFGFQAIRFRDQLGGSDPRVRERGELLTILRILESSTAASDLHGAMFDVVCRIAESVDAVRCSILQADDEITGQAFVVASHDDRNLKMLPLNLAKYPEVQAALRRGKPVIVEDVEKSDLLQPHLALLLRLNYHSLVVMPILFRQEAVGALCLRASRKRAFTDGDLRFCRRAASAAAGAIKIAALARTSRERTREVEEIVSRSQYLFDHSPDLILRLGTDGRIREANGAAERATGRSRPEILCMDLTSLIRGLPSLAVLRDRVRGSKAPLVHEARLLAAGNMERDLAVTVGATGAAGGDLMLIGRDVTDQKRTSALLQHAEKLSSIGEIVASVTHELNNPLLGVTASSELLAQKDKEGKFKRDIERIVECSDRCRKIIQNLLNYARPMADEKRPIGLNTAVEKTLNLLEHSLQSDRIEVVKELAPDLPDILADFHQVQQVLTNLISNAQHAMSADKGRGRLSLRTSTSNGRVILEIEDDGPGITSEALPRIFDPFFSTKKRGRGTGLGLSVSNKIIRDHGGELRVDTRVGRGTTFQVIFPIHDTVIPGPSPESPATKTPGSGKEILVVDDEEAVIDLYLELLRAFGHSIDTASTGLQALRKIETRDYDLIITDIRMPKMSGIDLYEKVVSIKPELRRRFIFITGAMSSLTSQEFLAVADSPCLLKPVSVEKIEATMREVLGQPSPDRLEGPGSDTPTTAGARN